MLTQDSDGDLLPAMGAPSSVESPSDVALPDSPSELLDGLISQSLPLKEDHYKLLKKIPAMHETFFRVRRFFLPIFSAPRYYVIKSHYLLCYNSKSSEVAFNYYNELEERNIERDRYNGPHSRLTPKEIVMLEFCAISSSESRAGPLIHLKNPKGKALTFLCNSKQQCDAWMRYLSRAIMKPCSADFQTVKFLGKGSFGEVTLAIHKPTGTKVALKRAYVESNSLLRHCLEERSIFEKVSGHPFIVNLCYAFREERSLYYAQQYCPGGDLYSQVKRKGPFPEVVAQFYGAEILLALGHLHLHHILHRDIKPENVLLDEEGHACLTDFGLSKLLVDRDRTNTVCGSELYYAPELFDEDECELSGYDTGLDFWQYGNLMFELLTGHAPFASNSQTERREKIVNEDPDYPETLSKVAVSFLRHLLDKNPRLRARDAHEVMKHPFFNGIDWENILARRIKPPVWNATEKDVRTYVQDPRPLNPRMFRLESKWELELIGFDYIPRSETSTEDNLALPTVSDIAKNKPPFLSLYSRTKSEVPPISSRSVSFSLSRPAASGPASGNARRSPPLTLSAPRSPDGPPMNLYSFTSQPKPVQKTRLYRDATDDTLGTNIMFDPRVVRGSAFISHDNETSSVAASSSQREQERRRIMSSVKSRQNKSGVSVFDIRPPSKGYEPVDLTAFLEDQTPSVDAFEISTQTDEIEDPSELSSEISSESSASSSAPETANHSAAASRPVYHPFKSGVDSSTQLGGEELFRFDYEVEPLLHVLTSKILEQSQIEVCEEEELDVICNRKSDLERATEEEKSRMKRLERRHIQKQVEKEKLKQKQLVRVNAERIVLDKVVSPHFSPQVRSMRLSSDFATEIKKSAFAILQAEGFFVDVNRFPDPQIEEDFLPWLYSETRRRLSRMSMGCSLVDLVIQRALSLERSSHSSKQEELAEIARQKAQEAARESAERTSMSDEERSSRLFEQSERELLLLAQQAAEEGDGAGGDGETEEAASGSEESEDE